MKIETYLCDTCGKQVAGPDAWGEIEVVTLRFLNGLMDHDFPEALYLCRSCRDRIFAKAKL